MKDKTILAILDASAIYAIVKGEPCNVDLHKILEHCVATTYNIAEVVNKMVIKKQSSHAEAWLLLQSIVPYTYPIDMELSELATSFSEIIDAKFGISLGDKLCLALGKFLDKPIYTGDKVWKQFEGLLGITIHLIR